jgi:hypothetical protein
MATILKLVSFLQDFNFGGKELEIEAAITIIRA